jgi:hypothetical protein
MNMESNGPFSAMSIGHLKFSKTYQTLLKNLIVSSLKNSKEN